MTLRKLALLLGAQLALAATARAAEPSLLVKPFERTFTNVRGEGAHEVFNATFQSPTTTGTWWVTIEAEHRVAARVTLNGCRVFDQKDEVHVNDRDAAIRVSLRAIVPLAETVMIAIEEPLPGVWHALTGNVRLTRTPCSGSPGPAASRPSPGRARSTRLLVTLRRSAAGELVKVTSPPLTTTTTGAPLIAESTYPDGRSEIYGYSGGKLALVLAPKQARLVPESSLTDVAFLSPLARVENTWTADRVTRQRVGGTVDGVTAGGNFEFTYQALTPSGADPVNDETQQVTVEDRAGNLSDCFLNAAGQCVRLRRHTNRNVRALEPAPARDPAFFESCARFNSDGLLLEMVPQGFARRRGGPARRRRSASARPRRTSSERRLGPRSR